MRDATGRWLKGAPSPNPGGRPRDTHALRDLAQTYTREAIEALVTIMRSEEAPPAARAAAASALLDRGWGRPHSTSDIKLEVEDLAAGHIEAIRALAARRISAAKITEVPAAAPTEAEKVPLLTR